MPEVIKIRYPHRDDGHVKETRSFKAFEQAIPDAWLIRHVTERDYGIDCLVEIVIGGTVNGYLTAIQLKGTNALSWAMLEEGSLSATFSGTRVETVNYWMGLPVPVFLCIYEEYSSKIYFADVKHQVRRRFRELKKQKTFGFKILSFLELTDITGPLVLGGLYFKERGFEQFSGSLLDLMIHGSRYTDYIMDAIGRDFFLEVELDDLIQLVRLYRNCQVVASFLDIKWKMASLQEIFEEDRRNFNNCYEWLHEYSREKILRELAPIFVQSLCKGTRLVHELEKDFWRSREPILVMYAEHDVMNRRLDELEATLKPLYEK